LEEKQTSEKVIETFQNQILSLLEIFGLKLDLEEELLDEEIDELIKEREEARTNKDYQRADDIRDLLKEKDILLEDTAQGVRCRRAGSVVSSAGDAAYEVHVTELLMRAGQADPSTLPRPTVTCVSAKAQADVVWYWQDNGLLSDEEERILKRASIAKSRSTPKN